ncbi:MAG: hypothetical protein HYY91_00795 [Candidatus Omnitrophica bacterium]|nr:hypothetical protein [Candidatus Omnitrophota bacterium]
MKRHTFISLFVLAWIAVFHYETLRLTYLSPLAGRELPKLKFLYPPAGWIMFFNVDRAYGMAEVYGTRQGRPTLLDPHDVFATRFVGYDNIHRNVLVSVLHPSDGPRFCRYLARKFPPYDDFVVAYRLYPDLAEHPNQSVLRVMYRCQ